MPQAKLVRIRGTIEKVDGQNLEVKSREGKNVKVMDGRTKCPLHRDGQSLAHGPHARHLYRRHRDAAGRRQPAGDRDPHLPAGAARHRRRLPAVGPAARQHHDQCRDRDHGRRHRRPGGDGALQGQGQGRREEGDRDAEDRDRPLRAGRPRRSQGRRARLPQQRQAGRRTARSRRRPSATAATASVPPM